MEKLNPSEIERLAEKIKQITAAIKSDSNPEELVEYSKLIKKNVSFFDRGYFAAYLLRDMEKKAPVERSFKKREGETRKKERAVKAESKKFEAAAEKAPKKERADRPVREARERKAPIEIPADAKTLYVNLGKMGRVYARDLIDLIIKATGVSRDDIYSVRVHDKYSFVTMSEENCNKAIEALQGTDVRGRTVQINISNRENSQKRRSENKVEEKEKVAPSTAVVEESPVEERATVVEESPVVEEKIVVEETTAPVVEESAPEAIKEDDEDVITFSVREI
ncbi:MAG: DbpA RNA binding domain-containing protein [Sphaerochaetaceae bacterium]|nr:DbpA RNA binding domain-containing protein [Sphaerochaetaceae bacterium]